MPQGWQDACVWVKGVWHTQDQDLIRTNNHAYALNIHYNCLLPDENGCRVRDGSLQVDVLTHMHLCVWIYSKLALSIPSRQHTGLTNRNEMY